MIIMGQPNTIPFRSLALVVKAAKPYHQESASLPIDRQGSVFRATTHNKRKKYFNYRI